MGVDGDLVAGLASAGACIVELPGEFGVRRVEAEWFGEGVGLERERTRGGGGCGARDGGSVDRL